MTDRHKVHGFLLEPSSDGADKNGYIHFYDVIEADSQDEAFRMAYEDYGEYNTLEHHGIARTDAEVEDWLAKNPD
jgi:hypothetical protein